MLANVNKVITNIEDLYPITDWKFNIATISDPYAINLPFLENLDENGIFLVPSILKKKYQNNKKIATK